MKKIREAKTTASKPSGKATSKQKGADAGQDLLKLLSESFSIGTHCSRAFSCRNLGCAVKDDA